MRFYAQKMHKIGKIESSPINMQKLWKKFKCCRRLPGAGGAGEEGVGGSSAIVADIAW